MTYYNQIHLNQPLGRKLSLIAKDFLCLLNTKLSHIDLDRNYYALILIGKANGEMTQQELATKLESDKVSIVRIIDYLTEQGYVTRINHKEDRRKYCLTLTTKAEIELIEIENALIDVHKQSYKGLTETEICSFNKTLSIIQKNLKH
jgi:DNA-binding MarR family transcriptional regulator